MYAPAILADGPAPVAAISHHSLLLFFLQVATLLALAVTLGRLATRLGMPSVVGELLAGVLVGPSLLGAFAPDVAGWLLPAEPDQMHLLDALGQLGVILLVGLTGMEIDLRLVRRRGATAARVSLASLVVPLGLGIGAGLLLPDSVLVEGSDRGVFALFLGVALCVSAIPVAAKILIDMKLLHRNVGQLTLAAATVDDAVGWLLLSVVSAMATTGVRTGDVVVSVASMAGVVLFAVVVGRPLARLVIRLGRMDAPADGASDTHTDTRTDTDRRTAPAVALVVILLAAAATHALKLEAILGAFFAGILLGSGRGFDARRIEPLRTIVLGVLAPLFFATAGLRIDLTELARPSVALTAVVMLSLAVLGKFSGAYVGARASRLGHWESLALGAGLNARGVIEVVVAGVGLRLGVLSTAIYTVVVLIAIVTSIMAPPILRATMRRVELTADEELRQLDLVNEHAAADGGDDDDGDASDNRKSHEPGQDDRTF